MMRDLTPIVKQLLIINVLFFIGANIVGQPAMDILGFNYYENPKFYPWQPITHMFLHFDIMHVALNMLVLYMFGPVAEERWGSTKFIFFYLSCGLGAAMVHFFSAYYSFEHGMSAIIGHGVPREDVLQILSEGKIDTRWQEWLSLTDFINFQKAYFGSALGASGAIAGIMVAFAVTFPNAELGLFLIPVRIKAKYFVLSAFTLDLVIGLAGRTFLGVGEGVGHFAHFGGALIGFIMAWYWKNNHFNKYRKDR